ncbi:MAG TPA: hypothetical protein VHC69_18510 [Polyangiaceae bacterium]|nr:hypothetical protein [Polyangiaceae bacterium]
MGSVKKECDDEDVVERLPHVLVVGAPAPVAAALEMCAGLLGWAVRIVADLDEAERCITSEHFECGIFNVDLLHSETFSAASRLLRAGRIGAVVFCTPDVPSQLDEPVKPMKALSKPN